jgi:hypothetical protein
MSKLRKILISAEDVRSFHLQCPACGFSIAVPFARGEKAMKIPDRCPGCDINWGEAYASTHSMQHLITNLIGQIREIQRACEEAQLTFSIEIAEESESTTEIRNKSTAA